MTHIDGTIDETFAHSYECERLAETPERMQPHYYYPGASTEGGRDGILVKVRPERGLSWYGTFAFGQVTPKGISGIFTTPGRDRLCVVSRGEGYIVSAESPTVWEAVPTTPIIDVRPIRAQRIIVFADHTTLIGYGETGIKWKTERLTWDNLRIIEVTDAFIKGEFWDIRSEMVGTFVVDVATGAHRGGIKRK